MSTQLVDSLRIEKETVWVRPCSAFGSRYLADDFWVAYDASVDLEQGTEAVALMPFALAIVTAAWASGDTWVVPELDAVQAEALLTARAALRGWYTRIPWDGELEAERTTTALAGAGGPDVILFSGGVDSTYSALSEAPGAVLLLVRGIDIALDNGPGWARVRREAQALAERAGHTLVTAETSLRRHLRRDVADNLHREGRNWWGSVQHGLALAGLGIPVAASRGGSRVLVPATLWPDAAEPLGSLPELDESGRWSSGEVVHHGFEVSRHGKLRWLVERSDEIGPIFLRVCYSIPHGAGGNCLSCEKCLRTALALMLEGRDPLPFGLPIPPREVERRLHAGVEKRVFESIAPAQPMWAELAARAVEHPGLTSAAFRDWFLPDMGGFFEDRPLLRAA